METKTGAELQTGIMQRLRVKGRGKISVCGIKSGD